MKGVFQVEMKKMIPLFMDYCMSRQLRPKTMLSYEQANRLFALWLEESEGVKHVEEIKDMHIRRYIIELQTRGKYTFTSNIRSREINHPDRRTDHGKKLSNITINNYLRNIRVFFAWLVEIECIPKSPMTKVRELPEERNAKEYLTDEEVLLFLKSLDKTQFHECRDYIAAMVMLDCGTRLGETLSVEMDVLDHHFIIVILISEFSVDFHQQVSDIISTRVVMQQLMPELSAAMKEYIQIPQIKRIVPGNPDKSRLKLQIDDVQILSLKDLCDAVYLVGAEQKNVAPSECIYKIVHTIESPAAQNQRDLKC